MSQIPLTIEFQKPPIPPYITLGMVEAQVNALPRADDSPSPNYANEDDNTNFDFKNKTLTDFNMEEQGRPKRVKTTNACLQCQKKKVRCEGLRPCVSCVRHRLECVPSTLDNSKKRPTPRTVEEIIQERLDRIEEILQGLFGLMPQAKDTPDADVKRMVGDLFQRILSAHQSPGTSSSQMNNYFPEPDEGAAMRTNNYQSQSDTSNDKSRLIKALPNRALFVVAPTSTSTPAPVPAPTSSPISSKPETLDLIQPSSQQQYLNDRQEVHVVDALDEMFGKLNIDTIGRFVGETTAYHFPKDRLGTSNAPATPFQCHLDYTPESHLPEVPLELLHFPTTNDQFKLMDQYFKYVHPFIPVINEADFYHQVSVMNNMGNQHQPLAYAPGIGPNPLLLLAVFTISAKYIQCPPIAYYKDINNPSTIGGPFLDSANRIIDYFMDTPRISTVAALILLAKHLEDIKQSNTLSRSWMLAGMAFRMAQDLGLNRDCENWGLSKQACQLRKRVFWSLFAFDRVFSGGYGRPMTFDEKDCNIGYPKPENEDDIKSQNMIRDFHEYIKLTKIIGRILKYNYSPQSCAKTTGSWTQDTMLITLDSTLASWLMHLPENLRWIPAVNNARSHLGDYAKILHMLFHSVLILLHRPYILNNPQGASTNPPKRNTLANFPSLTICSHAANLITELGVSMMNESSQDLRKLNAGVYCLFTAARVHLMNVASSEFATATQAELSFENTIKTLNKLMEHDPYHGEVVPDTISTLQALFERQKQKRGPISNSSKKQPKRKGEQRRKSVKPTASAPSEPIVNEPPNSNGIQMTDMEQAVINSQVPHMPPEQLDNIFPMDETVMINGHACINSAGSTPYSTSNGFSNSSRSPSTSPHQSSRRSTSTTPPVTTNVEVSLDEFQRAYDKQPFTITLLQGGQDAPAVMNNYDDSQDIQVYGGEIFFPQGDYIQNQWQQNWTPFQYSPYPYMMNGGAGERGRDYA